MANCELCGEPMPAGEEMFRYHGLSGPCPKPPKVLPLKLQVTIWHADRLEQLERITTSRSYERSTGYDESAPQRGDLEHSQPLLVFAAGKWQRGVYVWTEVWHKTQYHEARVLDPNAFKAALGDSVCLRDVAHFTPMLPDPRQLPLKEVHDSV